MQRWKAEESVNHTHSDLCWSHCHQGSHLCHYRVDRDRISTFGLNVFFNENVWQIEESIQMTSYHYSHCSVALGSRFIALGGKFCF